MTTPRKHHLVPQFLLNRFADKKNRIVMVSRDQQIRRTVKVKEACHERDFYAIEGIDGWSQGAEALLSKIESDGAAAVDTMLNGEFPPKETDREKLALLIAFQCLRGKDARTGFDIVIDSLAKAALMATPRSVVKEIFIKSEGRTPTEDEIEQQMEFMQSTDEYTVTPHQNLQIKQMIELAPGLARTFQERRWILFDHAESCLVTSDTPAIRWSDPSKSTFGGATGWVTADVVQMPLSPRHCLTMSNNAGHLEQVRRLGRVAGPQAARHINLLVATGATRWIFHQPESDPLAGVVLPPSQPPVIIDTPWE